MVGSTPGGAGPRRSLSWSGWVTRQSPSTCPGTALASTRWGRWPRGETRSSPLSSPATSSSAWAFELSQLAPQLLGRLQEALGGVAPEAIRFAPGKLPDEPSAAVEGREKSVVEPSKEDVERAFELAARIEDESLREVVAKTVARGLARASDDRRF